MPYFITNIKNRTIICWREFIVQQRLLKRVTAAGLHTEKYVKQRFYGLLKQAFCKLEYTLGLQFVERMDCDNIVWLQVETKSRLYELVCQAVDFVLECVLTLYWAVHEHYCKGWSGSVNRPVKSPLICDCLQHCVDVDNFKVYHTCNGIEFGRSCELQFVSVEMKCLLFHTN